MKSTLVTLSTCFFMLMSSVGYANFGTYQAIDDYTPPACKGPTCPFGSNCDCTDPYCRKSDISCLSRCDCCAAFGNVGRR